MGIGTRVVVSGSVVDGGVEEVLAGYRGYLVGERGCRWRRLLFMSRQRACCCRAGWAVMGSGLSGWRPVM